MAARRLWLQVQPGSSENAALRHFDRSGGAEVVALSRRKPRELYGAVTFPIDLTDPAQCTRAATELQGAPSDLRRAL